MPRYKFGSHNGAIVIRAYSGRDKNITRTTVHENGNRFNEMHKQLLIYNKYDNLKNQYANEIKLRHLPILNDFKFINDPSIYDCNIWKAFVPSSNSYEIRTDYYDDYGNRVRSRGEMLIGNALKSLGLEAKYEPSIILKDGRKIHPDYSFPVPIICRCFFIEFIGMTGNEEYINYNYGRIDEYMRNDVLPNRDLILICGTDKWLPTQESMKRIIASFINNAVESVYSKKI